LGPYSLVYLVVVQIAANMEEENRSSMFTTAVSSRDLIAIEKELHHQPSEVRGPRRLLRQMTKLAIREVGGNR